MGLNLLKKYIYHQYQNKWIAFYSLWLAKMEKIEINGKLFQIKFYSNNWIYMVSMRDGENFVLPYYRNVFKTRSGAIRRCHELAKDN